MAIELRTLSNGMKAYVARVWDPVLGRKVSRSFSKRRDAERAETDMKLKAFTGGRIEAPRDVLFSDLAEEVLANCTASTSTLSEYRYVNANLIALIGKKSMRQLSMKDVDRVVAELSRRLAPNTVNKHIVRLRHICERAVAYGYITISPAKRISNKPKIVNVREMEILDEDEIRQFLECAGDFWRPLFMLWFATGQRVSEILGLDPACIDVANRRVHVRQQLRNGSLIPYTKSRKPRSIPVSEQILAIVVSHMQAAPHAEGCPVVVFPSKTGRPIHYGDFVRDIFKPVARQIGHPGMVTHDIRHAFASHALSQGMNIKVLQELLGHGDAALTLNKYAFLIPSDGRDAAEKMADFLLREENVTTYGHSVWCDLVREEAA